MIRFFFYLCFGLISSSSCFAATIYDTLFINKGLITTVDTNYFAYYAFNNTSVFETTNHKVEIGIGDSLYLTVINTDSLNHGFDITNTTGYNALILPNDTVTIPTKFNQLGNYIFYDDLNYPNYRYLGLGGMITVDNFNNGNRFHWNIKDHQGIWNDSIANGNSVDWMQYYPDYFTINGYSNPFINEDTTARVTGLVGDTIRIYIANTGQGIHSLHFHGYHLRIVYSSKYPNHVNREKDTFPVHSMATMILELIPDKIGEYPVHDHNLVAVSGGQIYPNGMFLTLLIE